MKRLLSISGITTLLALTLSINSQAAVEIECDRECLSGFMDSYLRALISHDSDSLAVTRNIKYTENGVRLSLGDGLWQTAVASPTYRVDVIDEEAGSIGLLGRIDENGNNNWFAVRLKVEKGEQISEIETLIARSTTGGGGFGPSSDQPHPLMMQTIPENERLPRAEIATISNSYFTGLDTDNHGRNVPFSADCQRRENGTVTANNRDAEEGSISRLDCQSQFDTGFSVIVTDIRERRFEVVDPVTGLGFGWGYFDHNGTTATFSRTLDDEVAEVSSTFRQPFSFYIAEVFKVVDGDIRQIEAVLTTVPYSMESGW